MPGRIVVATDGSDTGYRAVDFAAELSEKFDKPLSIVHVLLHGRPSKEVEEMAEVEGLSDFGVKREEVVRTLNPATMDGFFPSAEDESAIARMIASLGEHVVAAAKHRAEEIGARNVTAQTRAGDTAEEILDVAKSEKADMIVLGRRGLGRVREVLLGSVSQKVLHHADCTVIVVH